MNVNRQEFKKKRFGIYATEKIKVMYRIDVKIK